jgi:hypothetical protein
MNDIIIPEGFGPISDVFGNNAPKDELLEGVRAGMNVLKYAQGSWTMVPSGAAPMALPTSYIDVCIVRAAPTKSKTFYPKFDPTQKVRPTCWSNDAVTPASGVPNPISPSCLTCKNDVFGSRTNDLGGKAKACTDYRRIAVMFPDDLLNDTIGPMLFRVPAASLVPLQNYSKTLNNNLGATSYQVITRIQRDPTSPTQRLMFIPQRPLNREEALAVLKFREDQRVTRITGEDEYLSAAPALGAPIQVKAQPSVQPEVITMVKATSASKAAKPTIASAMKEAQAKPAPATIDAALDAELDSL